MGFNLIKHSNYLILPITNPVPYLRRVYLVHVFYLLRRVCTEFIYYAELECMEFTYCAEFIYYAKFIYCMKFIYCAKFLLLVCVE
jgi:hypothetical protein